MDLKKISFSDQFLSSPRRKVVWPKGVGTVLFFIVLSALLFSFSSKGPFFSPIFQGFSSFGSYSNTSFVSSWRFSASVSNTTSGGGNVTVILQNLNETLVKNGSYPSVDLVSSDGEVRGFKNASAEFKNGSFIVGKGTKNGSETVKNPILVDVSGNLTKSGAPNVGEFVDNVKNESVSGNLTNSGAPNIGEFFSSVKNGSVSGKENGFKGYSEGRFVNENSTGSSVEDEHSSCGAKIGSVVGDGGNCSGNGDLGNRGMKPNDRSLKNCDIFNGRWVKDDTLPYYPSGSCPYIDRDFECHQNGRADTEFEKWRWQPYDCDIPRFNATDFLRRLRGKKLVLVGDSLNRNMWESLVCILRHGVEDKKRVYEISGRHEFKKKGFYAFRFEDYNCTVDFVSSPFLVKESFHKGKNGTFETLRLDLMDATTSMYHDADVLIFNTGHWWTHEKTSRGEGYYQEGNYVHPRLKVMEAYKRALATWARWVDKNIDTSKTEVVFRGYSVTHFSGGPWNSGGQCNRETEPIFNETYLAKYPTKMKVLEYVLKDMKTPVTYLNISRLTDYRKDGHPSIYRPDYQAAQNEVHVQDCSHWCLPGVPDTWNELLYASLLQSGRGSWKDD